MIKNEVQRLILLIHLRKYEDKSKRQLCQDQADRNHTKKFWFWQLSEMQIGRRIRPLVELSGETKGATGKMTTRQVFGGARPGDNIDSIGKHRNSSRLFVWPTHLPWAAFRLKKKVTGSPVLFLWNKRWVRQGCQFSLFSGLTSELPSSTFLAFFTISFCGIFFRPTFMLSISIWVFFGKFLSFRLFFHIEPLRERHVCLVASWQLRRSRLESRLPRNSALCSSVRRGAPPSLHPPFNIQLHSTVSSGDNWKENYNLYDVATPLKNTTPASILPFWWFSCPFYAFHCAAAVFSSLVSTWLDMDNE